jgi:cellobiose transport system substrate-binding protein
MKWTRTRAAGVLAVGTASALVLSACGNEAAESATPTVHTPVTLTVAYWGNFGFTEDAKGPSLESVYEAAHPWVSLDMQAGEYNAVHDNLTQALIAGSGAPSINAIDEGFITGFVAQADGFVNLLDLGAEQYRDDFLPWKWDEAANADGSVVIGLGYDVGGLAMCYRKDLFEAAGLPSDRDEVSAAVGDSWEDFIAFGEQYVDATGKGFVDNATNLLNPALMQLGTGYAYYDRNDRLDMASVKPAFNTALDVIEAGLSAGIGRWSPEWNEGFSNGDFAVTLCPMWMLDYIEGQIPADFEGQWDIADIPGPGGNWGGSFYTIPRQGTAYEQQAGYNFVEWLIQPEQQLKIMKETGNLPAQISILESDEVKGITNEFFNDAPVGEIYAKTVLDLPAAVYHSRCEGPVRVSVETVLNDVQAGLCVPLDTWGAAVQAAEAADECT